MKKLYFLLLVILVSCCPPSGADRTDLKNGKATLVGYKVAKHSHMWLKLNETGTIHYISGLGGRRIPTINLGDVVDVQYYIDFDRIVIVFDPKDYVEYPRGNTSTRYECLQGYENLY